MFMQKVQQNINILYVNIQEKPLKKKSVLIILIYCTIRFQSNEEEGISVFVCMNGRCVEQEQKTQ